MVKTKLAINRHSERNISINLSFPFEDIIFNIDWVVHAILALKQGAISQSGKCKYIWQRNITETNDHFCLIIQKVTRMKCIYDKA